MKEYRRRERACQESRGVACLRLPHGVMSLNVLTMFYYKGLYVRVCVVCMPTNLCRLECLSVSAGRTVLVHVHVTLRAKKPPEQKIICKHINGSV